MKKSESITELKKEIIRLKSKLDNVNKNIKLDKSNGKLNEFEENYKNIFNVSNDTIFIYNKKSGIMIDANTAAVKMYGYSRNELMQMKAGALSSGKKPYSKEDAKEWIRKASRTGPQKFQWRSKHRDGTEFWVEIDLKTVIFNGKEAIISIEKNIDKRKQAVFQKELVLKALLESEGRYKTLIENIRDGVIVHSNNKIVYVNPASIKIIGNEEPESFFIGKSISEFIHPVSIKEIGNRVKSIYEKKGNVSLLEEKFIRTDGRIITTEVMASMIDFNEEPASLVVFRDITERKQTEQKLKESEFSYKELFNNAIDSIYIQDENGVFLDVNHGAEKMYGYTREFLIGKSPEILSAPGKNDMEMVKNCLIKTLEGKPQQFEFWGKRKTGEIFPKIVRLSRGRFFGKNVVFAFSLDISERKKAEEERLLIEAQIKHSQKLESLGLLAGGIAHDFNNLLTGILGNAGLARIDISSKDTVLNSIEKIETTAVRAAELCNQLLAYSGKGRFVILPVIINDIIFEMTKLLETSIPKKISISYSLSKKPPVIEVDITQFRQVIMNLILNAADSIGDRKGEIQISTGISKKINQKQETNLFLSENLKTGKFAYLEIIDNGRGMDQEVIDQIFDPFFTTKSYGRGLGLSAVIGIVKGHNGLISIKSKCDKGTEFRIYFPVSSKPPIHENITTRNSEKYKGSGTILVADDEESILVLSRTILEKAGFRVITAINGKDAIKKFTDHSDEIDLVLLDMTMPEKNGVEVMKVIKKIKPGIKAVLSSGYNKNNNYEDLFEQGFSNFLGKPYTPEMLIEVIRKITK